jgi:hypothetical protein
MERINAVPAETTSFETSSEDVEMPASQGADERQCPPETAPITYPPNTLALTILQTVRERQQGRNPSPSSRTQEYIREARSGGMYGHGDDAGE